MNNIMFNAGDALLDMLNATVAAVIDTDPDGRQKLADLDGKIFCLDISMPSLKLFMLPTASGIEFRRYVEADADVTLSGHATAFARLGLSREIGEKISVNGDADLGQTFYKILSQLDLDWEELLARRVGDTPARKLGNFARGIAAWATKSADLTNRNVGDYLREEKKLLVGKTAIMRFDETLNQTRADLDRLAARIIRIQRALESAPPSK